MQCHSARRSRYVTCFNTADSQRKVLTQGEGVFDRALPFSEADALVAVLPYIKSSLKYTDCSIVTADEAKARIAAEGEVDELSLERAEASEPGTPAAQFWNA